MSTKRTKKSNKSKIDTSNFTIKQVLSYTSPKKLSSLKKADLFKIATKGASFAETRRKEALKAIAKRPNMPLPMVYGEWTIQDTKAHMMEGTPKGRQSYRYIDFSVNKDMTLNELRSQMYYIRNFLKSKTSRYGDWLEFRKAQKGALEKAIQEEQGLEEKPKLKYLSKDKMDIFWHAFNTLKETDYTGYSSTQVQAMLYQDVVKKKRFVVNKKGEIDISELIEPLKERLRTGYEQKKQVISDVSDNPFDLGSNE